MIKKITVTGVLLFFLFQMAAAQDSIPLLKGKVKLSVTKGTMECDFILSNVPRINDYVIRINSGMNIRYLKNLDAGNLIYYDKSSTDSFSTGESSAYFFGANGGRGKFLPKAIQFKYVGMYPVVTDTMSDYSAQDWKGNIAFNGYSVRVDGHQSAWYPVLYDIKNDLSYEKVKYDIEIDCPDCNTIYVNGNLPVTGTYAHLKSDIPTELTMFSGKYKVAKVNGTYFLNPDINDAEIKKFGEFSNSYQAFYQQKLSIPYKGNITYIQTTPTSKNNAWMFVSYPSIFNIGWGEYGMKSFFDVKNGDWFKPYIAHELGHYYFGAYKVFNSVLGDMMTEGFAEYLSLTLTKNLIGDSIYSKKMKNKLAALKGFAAVPFAKVHSEKDYADRELYVYYYAPVIFTAIQQEIGQQKMWLWLKTILETKTTFTDYAFLEQTLSTVLHDDAKVAQLTAKYFYDDKSLDNAVAELSAK